MQGDTVDTLQISINASSSNASKSIDQLINNLSRLSKALDKFSSSVDASKFDQMDKSFKDINRSLAGLNTSKLDKASKSMKSLGAAMSEFGKNTLSGFSKLAGAGVKGLVGSVRDFGKSLFTSGRNSDYAGSRYKGLALTLSSLYLKFHLALRAISQFNNIIGDASRLTEVQNVVDTTFGNMSYKIEEFAKNAIKSFGMSELSAKQYASQFQAMGSSMGITAGQVARAQQFLNTRKTAEGLTAGYNAASKSMADMSINLTKLTADMASFYDVEQSAVAKALQSGILVGNSRPLRQFGLDVSYATLQSWALNNGLNANIKSMTQAEKVMLRYQYIMASTGAAQGDFAKTADTWKNSIVILKQEFQQLGIVIGSGLIQAIKPFVIRMNAALSGLITFAQNVVNALGKIFGWEMEVNAKGLSLDDSDLDYDTGGLEDVEDATDGVADAADNASKAVKKLNDQLQGFDKLNVLKTIEKNKNTSNKTGSDKDNGSDTGTGIGTSGGTASALLKKTKSAFESDIDNLYELGKYIQDTLVKAMDSIKWQKIYEKAANFGTGLANFLNGLISPKLFKKLANTIDNALRGALIALNNFAMKFDFANLGKSIEAGIIELLKNFPWSELKENAKHWAEGLADLLNNAITKDSMSAVGEALAEAINTAFEFLKTFGENFEWENFGKSLGAGLNSFLSNLDWKKYFSTAKTWGKGIANALNGFVDETDFYQVGESIANAIKTAVLFFLSLGSTIKWKDLGKALAKTVNGAIENFPAKEFADTFNVWVQGIFDGLVSFLSHVKWDKLGDKIVEFISNIDLKTITILLGAVALKKGAGFAVTIGSTILGSVKEKLTLELAIALQNGISLKSVIVNLKNFAWILPGTPVFDVGATALLEKLWGAVYDHLPDSWASFYDKLDKFIKETVIGGFFGMIEKAFSFEETKKHWDKAKENFSKGGIYIIKGIGEGILAGLSFLAEPIASVLTSVWEGFCNVFGISSPAEKMKPIGKYIVEGILEGMKLPDFASAFLWVANKFGDLKEKLGAKMGEIKEHLGTKWTEIKTSAGTFIEEIRASVAEKWGTFKEYIAPKMNELKTAIGDKWREIKESASTHIDTIKTNVATKWGEIKTSIGSKMDEIKKAIGNKWSSIKESVSNYITGDNSILSKAKSGFEKVKKGVGDKMKELNKEISSAWKTISTTAKTKISTGGDSIKSVIESSFKTIVDKVEDKFKGQNGLGKKIGNALDSMKESLRVKGYNVGIKIHNGFVEAINKIIRLFPIHIPSGWMKIPKIRLKTAQSTVLGTTITYPVGFEFYKKAYDNPFLFTSPTAIPGNLKVFGDGNGGEMVYGHANLMNDIREATSNSDMTAIGNRQLTYQQQEIQVIKQILEILANGNFGGISSKDMFSAVRSEAANYKNRTGREAFSF